MEGMETELEEQDTVWMLLQSVVVRRARQSKTGYLGQLVVVAADTGKQQAYIKGSFM